MDSKNAVASSAKTQRRSTHRHPLKGMIERRCRLPKRQSCFLFGARGSGKTTLLQQQLPKNTLFFDLLDPELQHELSLEPNRFLSRIHASPKSCVVIDEVQKLPILLDLVHQQIQKNKRHFILTGSSARRLKQKGTNLLAGRAWIYNLYPFSASELGSKFSLKRALHFGGLPEAYTAPTPLAARQYLKAYTGTYLEKEIQHEQWVRNMAPFRRFLSVAAQMNGQIINYARIGRDVGVDDVTVANYFTILEDTLLGFRLPAFHRSVRKAQKKAPKFYFIDTGIQRSLSNTLSVPLLPQTPAFGQAFEHWMILEFMKHISYQNLEWQCFYLRTRDDVEIDLVIQKPNSFLLVEFKSAQRVNAADAKALETLGQDFGAQTEKWLISRDPLEQKFGSTLALPWQKALNKLSRTRR